MFLIIFVTNTTDKKRPDLTALLLAKSKKINYVKLEACIYV